MGTRSLICVFKDGEYMVAQCSQEEEFLNTFKSDED